jgi:aminomethyltransferase
MTKLKKTPLYEVHAALGARMVPFAGYEMPVSYTGIIEEHDAVRERVGLFDVSHMGEFIVSGPGTFEYLDSVVTNNCGKLAADGVLYTVMCRENGTVVDDLVISRLADDRALVVANAANIEKDLLHLNLLLPPDGVELADKSDDYALLAVQGPDSRELLKRCPTFVPARDRLDEIGYYRYLSLEAGGDELLVSRTGYTGEIGFELLVPAARALAIWNELMENGREFGLSPVGLAARDTLRFEASFCLYGHELDDETTPLEAGLAWVVKFKKPGVFVGRDALLAEKNDGSTKTLMGLELEGRNIARQGYPVMRGEEVVGKVTSGTFSPTLKKSLCMAYIDADRTSGETAYSIQVRKKQVAASVAQLPFYSSRAR